MRVYGRTFLHPPARAQNIFFLVKPKIRYIQWICTIAFLALSISINKHAFANSFSCTACALLQQRLLLFFQTGVRDTVASRMLHVPADHEEFTRFCARPYGQHVLPDDPVVNHPQQHVQSVRLRYQGKPYADDARCDRADANRRARDCSSKSAAKNGMLFFLLFPHQSQIVSDVIYFVCVNSLGLYFRFMNEVVIRRSFLDRRKCVESTLRLNYEKDQEVGLNEL